MNGVPLAFLKFTRNDEAEADFLGIQYLYKAGYDPNAYVAFFGKIVQAHGGTREVFPQSLPDHPPTAKPDHQGRRGNQVAVAQAESISGEHVRIQRSEDATDQP